MAWTFAEIKIKKSFVHGLGVADNSFCDNWVLRSAVLCYFFGQLLRIVRWVFNCFGNVLLMVFWHMGNSAWSTVPCITCLVSCSLRRRNPTFCRDVSKLFIDFVSVLVVNLKSESWMISLLCNHASNEISCSFFSALFCFDAVTRVCDFRDYTLLLALTNLQALL